MSSSRRFRLAPRCRLHYSLRNNYEGRGRCRVTIQRARVQYSAYEMHSLLPKLHYSNNKIARPPTTEDKVATLQTSTAVDCYVPRSVIRATPIILPDLFPSSS